MGDEVNGTRPTPFQQRILSAPPLQLGEWVFLRDVVASLYGDSPAPWQYRYVARTVKDMERHGVLEGKNNGRWGKYVKVAA